MSLLEIIIISVGLSLDVFAVVVCYGAVLLKVERSKLTKIILIFSLWQVGAVVGGCFIMHIPYLRGIDAVIAGVGFGFMQTVILPVALSMLIITILVVIAGIYTGYRLGYEQKTKAYNIGGILLMISAINIIVKYMAMSIS